MPIFIRELQREKVWSRLHLVPLLLAEGDRDAYRRQRAALERETEIMRDVKGWQVCPRSPVRSTALMALSGRSPAKAFTTMPSILLLSRL
jgi:hypothetical protein